MMTLHVLTSTGFHSWTCWHDEMQCVPLFKCFYLGAITRPQIYQLYRNSNKKINKPHNFLSHFNHITLSDRMLGINLRCSLLFVWLDFFRKWWMSILTHTHTHQHIHTHLVVQLFLYMFTWILVLYSNHYYNIQHYCLFWFSSWQWKQIPPSPLCCTACGPPSEGLVTKQIRQDIYRCEKMHFSNTVWNSSVKCAPSSKPVHNEMRERRRERESKRRIVLFFGSVF